MAKYTPDSIRQIYEAIAKENRILPAFDEVDFETKYMAIELAYRQAYGIDETQPPAEGKTIEELRTEILTIIDTLRVYDQAGFFIGQPEGGQKLFSIPATRKFVLPENCAGSQAKVAVAPYTTATFSIRKNGYQIGVFTFPAGVVNATFVSDETNFAIGDVIEVYAPIIKDADLTDPCWNFKILWTD